MARLLDRSQPDAGADRYPPPAIAPTAYGDLESSAERRARAAERREKRRSVTLWWLERMIAAESPLREKLTWVWHGHFATSIDKVREAAFMLAQNQTLRTFGGGSFEVLTQAAAKDAAMLLWLDANTNRKGSPNENFARELMELFTIGIGNYRDADVREAARSFTGWRVDRITGSFRLAPAQVDTGNKTVLGATVQTGEQVIQLLTHSPAAAAFVTARLWSRLAYPVTTTDPIVAELAPRFAADLDITGLLRAILLHPQFDSVAARQGLVKEPVEYLVGALRALDMTASALDLSGGGAMNWLQQLGQVPFDPPSVGGWPQNGYWISTATSLARLKLANAIVNNASAAQLGWLTDSPTAARPEAIARQLGVDTWTPATAAALAAPRISPKQQLAIALVSPEYVLN